MPEGRRFKKGQPSPNPGGRPKGVAAYAREITQGGTKLVDYLHAIARDTQQSARDRISASRELLDRTVGRPEQTSIVRNQDDAIKLLTLWEQVVRDAHGDEETDKLEAEFKKRVAEDERFSGA